MGKLLPALMLIIISCSIGAIIRERMRFELNTIAELICDLKLMHASLVGEKRALRELLEMLSLYGKQRKLWIKMIDRMNIGEDIGAASMSIKDCSIPENCRSAFAEYFSSFGRGDAAMESEKLKALTAKLCDVENSMRKEHEKRMKLILPLSAMLGSALALIIL